MTAFYVLKKSKQKGFTLSELLVVISVLGIISTFTITKSLIAYQNIQNKALFRETYSALSQVLYQGWSDGTIQPNASNIGTYMLSHLNVIKICDTNASTQGCWSAAIQGSNAVSSLPGVMFANGVVVIGLGNCCPPGTYGMAANESGNSIYMDLNGTAGPNTLDQDQFWMAYCFSAIDCNASYSPPIKRATVGPGYYNPNFYNMLN